MLGASPHEVDSESPLHSAVAVKFRELGANPRIPNNMSKKMSGRVLAYMVSIHRFKPYLGLSIIVG